MGIRGFKERIETICSRRVLITLIAFLIVGGSIFLYTLYKYHYVSDFRRDILVEAHGMALDIVVIGTFIFALHEIGRRRLEKERNIQRYQEEIDDFRGCNEKTIGYRIAGNIKRLNRFGKTDIDLHDYFIRVPHLKKIQLQGADCTNANFDGTNLKGANFEGADLTRAVLSSEKLEGVNFDGAILQEIEIRGSNKLSINQLANVKTLYKAKLNPSLIEEIKKKYPHLLEKPEWLKEEEE